MLEAVNTFRTLKTDNGLPGSMFMLLEYEIFLYNKLGSIDIAILKKYILKGIIEYKFNMPISNHRLMYNKLQKEAMRESLISILPSNITNPIFRKKFSSLEKDNVKIKPMDKKEALKSVLRFMNTRLKNKSEINKLIDTFLYFQNDRKREAKSAFELTKEYYGQEIQQNQTSEDVFYHNLFSELKKLTIKNYKIKDNNIENLTYNDLILNKIYFRCYRYLANVYIKDKKRKIETSNIYDISFLYCSVIFTVFVDKRTFDLAETIEKEIGISLNLERNTNKL
jgi:tyrosyl-tRNA synthetase